MHFDKMFFLLRHSPSQSIKVLCQTSKQQEPFLKSLLLPCEVQNQNRTPQRRHAGYIQIHSVTLSIKCKYVRLFWKNLYYKYFFSRHFVFLFENISIVFSNIKVDNCVRIYAMMITIVRVKLEQNINMTTSLFNFLSENTNTSLMFYL